MRNQSRILFLFAVCVAAVLCASCVREVVMDAEEKPVVVVECVISNNPVQTLHLRYTKGASKTEYEVVTEADAVLYDLTAGSEAGRFVKAEDGVWTLDYEAVDEHEYRLEVSVPGYDLITAEQQMPLRPNVKAIRNSWCSISIDNGLGIFGARAETKMVWSEKPSIYGNQGYVR